MFLFDRSGDAVATEDAVADEEESHFLVESRKMEPEPVLELDQLVNLSCGNGDDGYATHAHTFAPPDALAQQRVAEHGIGNERNRLPA